MRRSTVAPFTLAACVLFALVVVGQAGPASTAPAGQPKPEAGGKKAPKERQVIIKADSLVYDDTTKTYVIAHAQKVELPDSEAILRADRIEWNREERWMRATGKPRLWDPQNELTADSIDTDLRAKRATAEGTVRLVAKPKEAKTEQGQKAREQIKEPVVVHCDTMEYFYKDKRGTATGNLKLTQKDKRADRTATGERLAYDGNEETVTLEGDVHFSNTKGEKLECKRVIFILKEGAEGFRIEEVKGGVFYFQEEEEEGEKPAAGGGEKPSGSGEKPAGGAAPPKKE